MMLKKKGVLYCLCVFAHINSIYLFKTAWKDDASGIYVLDDLYKEHITPFQRQFQDIPLKFNPSDQAYSSNFSTLGGFKSKIVPRKYKSEYTSKLTEVVQKFYPDKPDLRISAFQDIILERSDFNPVLQKCSNNISELIVMVILNENWKKNDYGDIGIYTENGEIQISFHPKFGRVICMKCGTWYKLNPPSMGEEKRAHIRVIEYTTEQSVQNIARPLRLKHYGNYAEKSFEESVSRNDVEGIDVAKYLTSMITTRNQREIFVFDNLFPEKLLRELYSFMKNDADYFLEPIEFDSEDNVRWLIDLHYPNFTDSRLWAIVEKVISYVSGGKKYYPYDISCNHIRRTDVTSIHQDCHDSGAIEYTNLIYLNPNWTPNLYGETIFLEESEFLAAITPKFGRFLVFDGRIDHSARPPTPDMNGARFSYAVKTCDNKKLAEKRLDSLGGTDDMVDEED